MGSAFPPLEGTQCRAFAARLSYLALDRTDIQFAFEDVAKYMASPSQGN